MALQVVEYSRALQQKITSAVERNLLERQERLDTMDCNWAAERSEAALLKLQQLSSAIVSDTYRPDDIDALKMLRKQQAERMASLQKDLKQAQGLLATFKALGPDYEAALRRYRQAKQDLAEADDRLQQFHCLENDLDGFGHLGLAGGPDSDGLGDSTFGAAFGGDSVFGASAGGFGAV